MVAITVCLAAVVGGVVLGLGTDSQKSLTAGVTVTEDAAGGATVRLVDRGTVDAVTVEYLGKQYTLTAVGDTIHVPEGAIVTLTGTSDGSRQLLRKQPLPVDTMATGWTRSEIAAVQGLDVGPDGNVYVVAGGSLSNYTATGTEEWSATSLSVGEIAHEVAVSETKYSYVAGSAAVHKFAPDGTEVWEGLGHTDAVLDVALDGSGYVYSASADNTVIKASTTGLVSWTFLGHTATVRAVAVGPDGYVYSGGDDNTVRNISPSGTEQWVTNFSTSISSLAVTADGRVYVGMADGTVSKLDSTGAVQWTRQTHTNTVTEIVIGPTYVYTTSIDNTVRRLARNGDELWTFAHSDSVDAVAVGPNSVVYTGASTANFTKHQHK